MSELLRLLSLIQTIGSAKYLVRAGAWILAALILWWLWVAESPLARFFAFVGVAAALYGGIWYFLEAPVEWTKYLFVKLIFVMLGASRLVIKIVLMGVAILLSAIYFISPIDFIPDILIGLGWIDDALVAFGLISYAANSKFSLPVPTISAEEAGEHPAWKVAFVATAATGITWVLRMATG